MTRIVLVRHGQASWHAEDYDVLTDTGHAQALAVGAELRARGIRPELALSGTLRRQRDTLSGMVAGAGETWVGVRQGVDARWDELDGDDIIAVNAPEHSTMTGALRDAPAAFDELFRFAMGRWIRGEGEYRESCAQFTARVQEAAADLAERLGPDGTAVVATSGGVCNALTSIALGGGPDTWRRLFGTFRNTSITQLGVGPRGLRLISLGEVSHLERAPHLFTDR